MTKNFLRSAIAAAFLVGATVASADPFYGVNPTTGQLAWDWYTSAGNGNVNTNQYNGGAGQFKGTFNPVGDKNELNDNFNFFCYELGEYATTSSVEYTRYLGLDVIDGVNASSNENQLAQLFNNYFAIEKLQPIFATWLPVARNTTDSVALQLAIWEIKYDNDLNLSTGNFISTGYATSEAQIMLNNLASSNQDWKGWSIYSFDRNSTCNLTKTTCHEGNQDYVSARFTSGDYNVPEPGSLALLGLGLAGLGFTRKVKLV